MAWPGGNFLPMFYHTLEKSETIRGIPFGTFRAYFETFDVIEYPFWKWWWPRVDGRRGGFIAIICIKTIKAHMKMPAISKFEQQQKCWRFRFPCLYSVRLQSMRLMWDEHTIKLSHINRACFHQYETNSFCPLFQVHDFWTAVALNQKCFTPILCQIGPIMNAQLTLLLCYNNMLTLILKVYNFSFGKVIRIVFGNFFVILMELL